MKTLTGSCLCSGVQFECEDDFEEFHFCHCIQCQKTTGSAHVSNLFTSKDNIKWLSGEDLIKRFDVPGREISTAFCTHCGSPVPYQSKSGDSLIIPAGVLNSAPTMQAQDHIFWVERKSWFDEATKAPRYDGFPEMIREND